MYLSQGAGPFATLRREGLAGPADPDLRPGLPPGPSSGRVLSCPPYHRVAGSTGALVKHCDAVESRHIYDAPAERATRYNSRHAQNEESVLMDTTSTTAVTQT